MGKGSSLCHLPLEMGEMASYRSKMAGAMCQCSGVVRNMRGLCFSGRTREGPAALLELKLLAWGLFVALPQGYSGLMILLLFAQALKEHLDHALGHRPMSPSTLGIAWSLCPVSRTSRGFCSLLQCQPHLERLHKCTQVYTCTHTAFPDEGGGPRHLLLAVPPLTGHVGI